MVAPITMNVLRTFPSVVVLENLVVAAPLTLITGRMMPIWNLCSDHSFGVLMVGG